jgi:predicted permease
MTTDFRHALRALRKNPGFTTVAILTLAVGIGANTAIFSVVNAVLLRPLPFADADRIVQVWTGTDDDPRSSHSAADFLDIQRENSSLTALAGYRNVAFSVRAAGGSVIGLPGAHVTLDFFDVLRAPAAAGRSFSRKDPPAINARAVVLSLHASRQLFGEPAASVGQILQVNGEPHNVVGVLGLYAEWPQGSRIWVLSDKEIPPSPVDAGGGAADREVRYFEAIGRLAPNATLEQAQADLARVGSLLQQRQAAATTPRQVYAGRLREQIVGDVRSALLIMQGAVGFVLLIACANVSSLLLARATTRRREIAIRAALGAGRGRLVRHLLVESLVLGLAGGALGLLLGAWLTGLLVSVMPGGIPRSAEISLDWTVAIVTLLTALATSFVFGVVPALQASRTSPGAALKATGERGSSGRARARAVLVVAEIALTLILLAGAGLLLNSFLRLQRMESGLEPEHVTVMGLMLPQSRYQTGASQVAFYKRLVERLSQQPEIQSVGVGFPGPLQGSNASGHFRLENPNPAIGAREAFANIGSVSGRYFQALGVPILAGRTFDDTDSQDAPAVAIVSAALARKYWPGESALGKRLRFEEDPNEPWITVVGLAGDVRQLGLDKDPPPVLYIPYEQFPLPFTDLAVRSRMPESTVAAMLRTAVTSADPDLPMGEMSSLGTLINRSIEEPRFRTFLLAAFAATALLLAAVGVYGLISYSVTQRRREIGIRVALGAQPRQVLVPVVREGLVLALTGAVLGLAGAFAASRLLAGFLFGVAPSDPATFAGVSVLMIAVALLATYIPSRRALQVDPVSALRSE